MYRLDLVLVFVVAFGIAPWRSFWSDAGAVIWTITVLAGVHVFLEWRYWYPSPAIGAFIEPGAALLRMFLQNRLATLTHLSLYGLLEEDLVVY